MKMRIIGAVFVIAILSALYVVTSGDHATSPKPQVSNPGLNENNFKDLKIN